MSKKNTYDSKWTANDIHRYLEGSMSAEEVGRFDTELANDPFLKDSVDGYAGHARLYVDHHLERLDQEFNKKTQVKRAPMWAIGAAASFLLLTAAWFMFGDQMFNGRSPIAGNSKEEQKTQRKLEASTQSENSSPNPDYEVSQAPGVTDEAEQNDMRTDEDYAREVTPPSNVLPKIKGATRRKRVKPLTGGIVSGVVTNEEGDPLIGANVYFPSNEAAITTDFNGNFAVELKAYDSVAIVNYDGFDPGIFSLKDEPKQLFALSFSDTDLSDAVVANEEVEDSDSEMDEVLLEEAVIVQEENQKSRAASSAGMDRLQMAIEATPNKGFKKYEKYIRRNLDYPSAARTAKISGEVIVQFKVLPNGELFDIRILQSLGYGCDEEAVRLVKEGPSWASEDQKEIRQAIYAIKFKL